MGKLAVGIDYNNICNRALFTCKFSSDVPIVDYATSEEQGILFRKICWDICKITNIFDADEVYIFADSKIQWRRTTIPDYKANRQRSEDIDYKSVYKVMDELLVVLAKKGYKVINIEGAEADDLAAIYKSKMFLTPDTSMVFVTSDHDWHQLISFDSKTEQFCAIYNAIANNKGRHPLTGTREFVEWCMDRTKTAMDMLCAGESSKSKIQKVLDNDEYCISLNEVNPNNVVLEKIMCGDDGDNVKTLFEYYKPDGKKKRITPTVYKKIVTACNIIDIPSLTEALKSGSLKTAVGDAMKYDVDDIDFVERVKMQRLSVELNPTLFPQNLITDYDNVVSKFSEYYTKLPSVASQIYSGTVYDDANITGNAVYGPKLNETFDAIINGNYKF